MSSAVIVGAGPGLGSAIARRFAAGGYDLALINRAVAPMAELEQQVRPSGRRVTGYPVDVTDATALTEAVADAASQSGPIAALVYNAISFTGAPPSLVAPADVRRDLDVAVGGLVTAVQAALPSLTASAAAGHRTSILITGGGAALYPQAAQGTLPITKAAQRAFAFALADELAPTSITVATITILGSIGSSDLFAPDAIADSFWTTHAQPQQTATPEALYGQSA